MKNNMMRKMKRTFKRSRAKGMVLVEMADDFMDIIQKAKLYRKINNKKR